MGIFEHFPYTNFHDLNLDWLLRAVKSLRDRLEDHIKDYNRTKVPGGGLKNQVLTKKSDSDYDMIWKDSSGIPAGGAAGDILAKNSAADFDASWHADNNIKKSGGTLDNAATLEFVDGANSAEIGAMELMATGEKFQFSGDFGFTNPVSGQPPVADNDLATKQYVDASTSSVDGVPAGGTTGQVLAKKTDADGDTEWVDQSGGGDFLPLAGGTMDNNARIYMQGRGIISNNNDTIEINARTLRINGLVSNPTTITIGSGGTTTHINGDVLYIPETTDADRSAATAKYVNARSVPAGGTTGQVLGKKSDSDRDCEWISAPTPDIPNLNNAFAYQLPFINDTARTELPGFFDDLTTHFKTTYGIMVLAFNNPGAAGSLTDTDARYCIGMSVSVYVALGATTTIPLYGISNGAMKKVATLELTSSRQAFITLADGIVTASALSAYISVSDFKIQKWFN